MDICMKFCVDNCFYFDGKLILFATDGSHTSFLNVANQCIERQIVLDSDSSSSFSGVLSYNRKVIGYNPIGYFSYYDLGRNANISSTFCNLHKAQTINSVVMSRNLDSMLLYLCSGDSKIRGILLGEDSLHHASPINFVSLKQSLSEETVILPHPSKSVLFAINNTGQIFVYDYSLWLHNSRKASRSGREAKNEGESSDNPENNQESGNDNGNKFFSGISRNKSEINLISTLNLPQLPSQHPNVSKSYVCSSWTINQDGTLMAVVYNEKVACMYDISNFQHKSKSKSQSRNATATDKIPLIQPIATYSEAPLGWFIQGVTFCNNKISFIQVLSTIPMNNISVVNSATTISTTKEVVNILDSFHFRKSDTGNVNNDSLSNPLVLCMHSLLDPQLRILFSYVMSFDKVYYVKSVQSCTISGKILLALREKINTPHSTSTSSNSVQKPWSPKSTIYSLDFSSSLYQRFYNSSFTSANVTSLTTFLSNDYNKSALTSSSSKVLLVSTTQKVNLNTCVSSSFTLYDACINMSTQNRHALTFVYDSSTDTSNATKSILIPDSDILHNLSNGQFIPESVLVNEESVAAIAGHFYSPRTNISSADSAIGVSNRHLNKICSVFIIERQPTQSSTYSTYRYTATWYESDNIQLNDNSNDSTLDHQIKSKGLICLSSNGQSLKLIPLSPSYTAETHMLLEPVSKLWSSPKGMVTCMIYSTLVDDYDQDVYFTSTTTSSSILTPAANINQIQKLIISSPGQILFKYDDKSLLLNQDEKVLNVVWQDISGLDKLPGECDLWVNNSGSSSGNHIKSDTELVIGMIGVLTTQRVLLLSPSLTILNLYVYINKQSSRLNKTARHHQSQHQVTSIQFVCATLLYTISSGSISYLLPILSSTNHNNSHSSNDASWTRNAMLSVIGEDLIKKRRGQGVLLNMPCDMFASGLPQIVSAVQTDRIVISYHDNSNNNSNNDSNNPSASVAIVSRPVVLAEIILNGLFAVICSKTELSPQSIVSLNHTLKSILKRYFTKPSVSGGNKTIGADPSTHGSAQALNVIYSLIEYQSHHKEGISELELNELKYLASSLWGAYSEESFLFPQYRWLKSGVIYQLATLDTNSENKDDASLCAHLFSNNMELSEILKDPASYGGSSLLRPKSSLGIQSSAAARTMLSRGAIQSAALLADFAGDDVLLIVILLYSFLELQDTNGNDNDSSNNSLCVKFSWNIEKLITRRTDFDNLLNALADDSKSFLQPLLTSIIRVIDDSKLKSDESNKHLFKNINELFESLLLSDQINRKTICGGVSRRQNLLSLSFAQDQKISKNVTKPIIASEGGFRNNNDYLMMDSIEDLVFARCYPESSSNGAIANKNNVTEAELSRPFTWIKNIGIGKEWEKLVGYWRFSDILTAEDKNFINTGSPCARLCFCDISKYGTSTLELFTSHTDKRAICIKSSSSPCDVGNGHQTVKTLYDISFTSFVDKSIFDKHNEIHTGMRTVVGRGSALDIGMFHNKDKNSVDNNRNKMTVELWVKYDSSMSEVTPSGNSNPVGHCLLHRSLGGPTGCNITSANNSLSSFESSLSESGASFWLFHINQQGDVCFSICHPLHSVKPVEVEKKKNVTTVSTVEVFGVRVTMHTVFMNAGLKVDADMSEPTTQAVPSNTTAAINHYLSRFTDWTHLSVVVDSSTGSTDKTHISLFIDGKRVVKSSLLLPHFEEKALAVTTLHVGANLSPGWNLTELRIWADLKTEEEINASPFNYLGLAAKKKRLFYQLKDYKEMFSRAEVMDPVLAEPLSDVLPLIDVLKRKSKNDKNEEEKMDTTTKVIATPSFSKLSLSKPNTDNTTTTATTTTTTTLKSSETKMLLNSPGGDLKPPPSSALSSAAAKRLKAANISTSQSSITMPIAPENNQSPEVLTTDALVSSDKPVLVPVPVPTTSTSDNTETAQVNSGGITKPALSGAAARRLQNKNIPTPKPGAL